MRQHVFRLSSAALLLGAMAVALLAVDSAGGENEPLLSQTSSALAAEPSPTYVSELAPAIVRPPETDGLPNTGGGSRAAASWPKFAGLGLAFAGALLVASSLRLGRRPAP